MVEIVLTARTEAGEKALRSYVDEKLTLRDRIRMRANNIVAEKRVVSESPFVVLSSISLPTVDPKRVAERAAIVREQLVLLYEKKMIDYGAGLGDFELQVKS